jgi:hypothetical protein
MNNKNIVTKSGNVTYYVNCEKKTVVAVVRCDVLTPLCILDRVLDKFENVNGNHNLLEMCFDDCHVRNALINDHYVGIAKCHEGDTFDEEFGKKLALARAKAKKADAIHAKFFKFIEQLDNLNYLAGKKSDELYRRWIDSQEEITELLQSIAKR